MDFLTSLVNSMPGAVAQGLIWGIMAIGVYITYRILDVADLTVDGINSSRLIIVGHIGISPATPEV